MGFALTLGAVLAAALVLNGGAFAYTLDDPYIHLALAEEIARGHYGLSPGAFSAPASSILWPFLIAPWARLPGGMYVPLLLNAAFAVGTIYASYRVLLRVLDPAEHERRLLAVATLGVGFVVATHLVGLVMHGMEHALQVGLAVVVVWGLIRERETGRVAWWLVAALVLSPLVRYEGLALSVPAVGLLLYRRHPRAAALAAVGTAVPLAAFSAFLLSNGHEALPTSVLIKSSVLEPEQASGALWGTSLIGDTLRNLLENMERGTGRVLTLAGLGLLGVAIARGPERADKALALWAATALGLHLAAGQLGWFGRYEVYAWATAVLVLLWLGRAGLRRLADSQPPLRLALLTALAVGLSCQSYVQNIILSPLASNNIYERHGQMHRFATEYWRGPVGVGDVGWVAFRNDEFVLDFNGLANRRTLQLKEAHPGTTRWIAPLTAEAEVDFVMVHMGNGFPTGWVRIGDLQLSRARITPSGDAITFFARDAATAARVRALLPGFIATLPAGPRFSLAKPEREAQERGTPRRLDLQATERGLRD